MNISKSSIRKSVLALAVTAGLVTAFVATAQPGPGFGPGMMGMHGGMGHGPGMMAMRGGPMFSANDADIGKFQLEQIAQLKSRLAITAEQQPAWDAFAARAGEQAKSMQAMRKDVAAGTAPERMKQSQQFMAERQKAMESMSESFTKLYDALTPKQREILDGARGPMHRHG
jgi:Spy/CpxP family protein refolding chaperone